MSVTSPERVWWRPLNSEEKLWFTLALIWMLVSFFWMPVWHVVGKQNPPFETYRVKPAQFEQIANAFIEKYKVGEAEGQGGIKVPIVHPPAGGDVFLVARMWNWNPVLELEKGKEYRVHLSSLDLMHGFSIVSKTMSINFMAFPEYDYVLKLTPTESGEYAIVCNEYCGPGHHLMVGKIIVK